MTPSKDIVRLLEIMEALRTPLTGCPWDLEQDFASIAPYTVGFVEMEEGYFLFAQIDAAQEAIRVGVPVSAKLIDRGGQNLPVFVLA